MYLYPVRLPLGDGFDLSELQTCAVGTVWQSDPIRVISTFGAVDRTDGRAQLDGFERYPLHSHVNQIIIGGRAVAFVCNETFRRTDVTSFVCQCGGAGTVVL